MKKTFTFTVETDTGFPDDLYNAEDFQQYLLEHLDELNWVFAGTPKCTVNVEEVEV